MACDYSEVIAVRCGLSCLSHRRAMEYGPSRQLANVKLWSTRRKPGRGYQRKRKASPQQIVGLRLWDFWRLFQSRFGMPLPDTDDARDDIMPVLHHMAALTQSARRMERWLDHWAPWMDRGESQKVIAQAIATARSWKADQLAWRYKVTVEERDMLGLSTIGAIDRGKAARTKRRKARDRDRKAAQRRAAGQLLRAEYEAAAIQRAKPWIEQGISRATWYRRNNVSRHTETGPATP